MSERGGKLPVQPPTSPIEGLPLSEQEKRVLCTLVGPGEPTVQTVARMLGIAEETAKSYLKRIREKLGPGYGSQTALLKYAIRVGLVPPVVPEGFVLLPDPEVASVPDERVQA